MGGLPYDDLTLRVLKASVSADGSKRRLLVVSEYGVDGFIAYALLKERLLQALSIPHSVFFMESLGELAELGPRLAALARDRSPYGGVVVLGFDQTLYEFAYQLSADPIPIFHIARDFRAVPFDRDVSLPHYHPIFNTRAENELKPTADLFDRPPVTLQVALAILEAGLTLSGADHLVAVVMASLYHHGDLDLSQYRAAFGKVMASHVLQSKGADVGVDDEGFLERKSSERVFPGLFFHSLTMQENVKYSTILQKCLHDLPRETWETEENTLRVKLKMSVEEWNSQVSGLTTRKQRELLKILPETKMLEYEPTHPMNQVPCVLFTTKKEDRDRNANVKRLTNFDLAFILDAALDGRCFKGQRPGGTGKRSKDWIGLNTITHQLTNSARNALNVFEAFTPVVGVRLGHRRSPLWSSQTREAALNKAIASYKKTGDKTAAIFDLLKERSSRPERMMSQAFRASAGLLVVYLTETAHSPLRLCDASFLMFVLSQALKGNNPHRPPVLLLQAGAEWTRLSMSHSGTVASHRDTLGRFKDLSREHVVSLGQMLTTAQHVLVGSSALWQVFAKSFERVARTEEAPMGGRRKRQRFAPRA